MTGNGDIEIRPTDRVLVTGANGFIGRRVVHNLLARGFTDIRALTRKAPDSSQSGSGVRYIPGNLLSKSDCAAAVEGVKVVFHLAAGTGQKSFADAFLNSVVTTRNLLEAATSSKSLMRFVNISSFAVYANSGRKPLDETCPLRADSHKWGDAYCYAKIEQERIVEDYCRQNNISYLHLRPGAVYGPGRAKISARVGVDPFGFFMHLGGRGEVPFTFVDNCAEAVVLAGIVPGISHETINIVDDDPPTSRQFLKLYKSRVAPFRSVFLPQIASYLFCLGWEKLCALSKGQLPPNYNHSAWRTYWKYTTYSNERLKKLLGWRQVVPTSEGLEQYFQFCRTCTRA